MKSNLLKTAKIQRGVNRYSEEKKSCVIWSAFVNVYDLSNRLHIFVLSLSRHVATLSTIHCIMQCMQQIQTW